MLACLAVLFHLLGLPGVRGLLDQLGLLDLLGLLVSLDMLALRAWLDYLWLASFTWLT